MEPSIPHSTDESTMAGSRQVDARDLTPGDRIYEHQLLDTEDGPVGQAVLRTVKHIEPAPESGTVLVVYAGGSFADFDPDEVVTVVQPSGPLDRRALWAAVAATHLPSPIDVTIYERPDPDGGPLRQWAGIRLDDNAASQVDAWARELGGIAKFGALVSAGSGYRAFRSYQVEGRLAGWPVEVCSYIDAEDAAEPAEAPASGAS